MKTIVVLFLLICFSLGSYSQGWVSQSSGVSVNLTRVVFADNQTGYVCGMSGKVLKTTNGGSTWTVLNTGTTADLYGLTIQNSQTVWACGSGGIVVKTTNGGTNWTGTNAGTPNILRCIQYSGTAGSNVYVNACGDNGVVVATANGGTNWFTITTNSSANLTTVYFPNVPTGYAFGSSGTVMYTTGGSFATWAFPTAETLYDVKGLGFILYAAADNWHVYRSINGGVNWTMYNAGANLNTEVNALRTIALFGKKVWAAGDNGTINYSIDSGFTWLPQVSNTSSNINSVFMIDSLNGWFAGDNGMISGTTSGGVIGIQQISSEVPRYYSLQQNYPNPFNPSTKIKFDVPASGKGNTSDIKIVLYDITGRQVAVLLSEPLNPGTYEMTFDASGYSSGVYFYRLVSGDFTATKKMLMVK